MRRFEKNEFVGLLQAIDVHLTKRCRVVLIGGVVLAFLHRLRHATTDLDVFEAEEHFWKAHEAAKKQSVQPLPPVQRVGIAEPPYNYEDRLERLEVPGLKRLVIFVPERHDFAMLKTVRGYAHDVDAIEELHKVDPLDLKVLVERYEETRVQAVGWPRRLRTNFLAVVERRWGSEAAAEVDRQIQCTAPRVTWSGSSRSAGRTASLLVNQWR